MSRSSAARADVNMCDIVSAHVAETHTFQLAAGVATPLRHRQGMGKGFAVTRTEDGKMEARKGVILERP